MKFKQLLTKSLLVAAGLFVGQSVWADVTETYDISSWIAAVSTDIKSYSTGSTATTVTGKDNANISVYPITSEINGNTLNGRVALSNTHTSSGLHDYVWFRWNSTETNAYTGLFVANNRESYFSILNLHEGDKVTITFKNIPTGMLFYSSNATYDDSGTPTAIVSGTTVPGSNKEYTMTADGHLDMYFPAYSCVGKISITQDISSYLTRMSAAKTAGTALSSQVMNSTVKSDLNTALGSEYVNMAESNITSENFDNYVAAIEALETANVAAQTSINDFIILNNLIGNSKPVGYVAPSGAETVYTSDADVDPVSLAAAVREAIIDAGMASENTDLSGLIINNSFELGTTYGWTIVESDDTGARSVGESGSTYYTSGADGSYLFNTWSKGTPITQNIGTLPAGKYTLACLVASNGATVFLKMNDTHNAGVTTSDGAVFINDTYTFTLTSATDVTIGAVGGYGTDYLEEGHWWYKADKFTLTYVGQDELAVAKASLEAEISTAQSLYDEWTPKVGTTPFKYDATYYNALGTQITSATNVLNGESETASDYTSAESNLETAESNMANSVQNKPDPDKFYRLYVANNDGTASDYNLNMLKRTTKTQVTVTATPYPVKFIESTGSYAGRYRIQTPYGGGMCTDKDAINNAYVSGATNVEERLEDIAISLQSNGTIKLSSTRSSNTFYYASSASEGASVTAKTDNTGTWTVSDAIDVTEVGLAVNATAGWGTFIAPYDNLIPSTVKAYTVSYKKGNSVSFEENETGVLSANTPYILSTEASEDVSTTFIGIANNSEDSYEVNGLVGLLTAGSVPANSYVLQYQAEADGTAFYKTENGMNGTANRCYLNLANVNEQAAGARASISFFVFGDDTTGINAVNSSKTIVNGSDAIYNPNGQRVYNPTNGLYIVNGKKFIVKRGK